MGMKERYTLIERSDTLIKQSYLNFAVSIRDFNSLLSTILKLVRISNTSISFWNNRLSTKE